MGFVSVLAPNLKLSALLKPGLAYNKLRRIEEVNLRQFRLVSAAVFMLGLAPHMAAAGTYGANLISDGTFDQSIPFSANSQFGTGGYANLPGWTVTAANGSTPFDLWFIASTSTTVGAATQYGGTNQYLRADAGADSASADFVGLDGSAGQAQGVLAQSVSNLVIGTDYKLSFDWAAGQLATGSGAYQVALAFNLGTSALTSVTGAPTTTTFSGSATGAYSGWTTQTYIFRATSVNEILSFLSYGTTGDPPFVLLDGVTLYAMPEPSTLALFGAVVGAALLMRRHKKLSSGL
jgi:hypothetical protein